MKDIQGNGRIKRRLSDTGHVLVQLKKLIHRRRCTWRVIGWKPSHTTPIYVCDVCRRRWKACRALLVVALSSDTTSPISHQIIWHTVDFVWPRKTRKIKLGYHMGSFIDVSMGWHCINSYKLLASTVALWTPRRSIDPLWLYSFSVGRGPLPIQWSVATHSLHEERHTIHSRCREARIFDVRTKLVT